MLVLFTVLLLVAIWGIIKPFKGFSRKQFAVAAACIFVVCIAIAPAANETGQRSLSTSSASSRQAALAEDDIAPDPSKAAAPYQKVEDLEEEAAQETLTGPQRNAVRSAQQYLEMTGFSRDGLIQQLSSEAGDGYSVADATAAVDSLSVDWNENAAKSARQYLGMTGFSCNGLIEQLSSSAGDKYTVDQATYGARQAGAC